MLRHLISLPASLSRPTGRRRGLRSFLIRSSIAMCGFVLLWLGASVVEWSSGRRLLPWNPYAGCGASTPVTLPQTVRVGLYEEFPDPWRLAHLKQVDFPVTLAVAARSRAEFLELRDSILRTYPQVRDVYFWPLLRYEEGYYPGTWSDAAAVRRAAAAAEGLPVLWDLEMPLGLTHPSLRSWPHNRAFLDDWLRNRTEPVHLWRSHSTMGLNPLFLRLVGMHYDPIDYPALRLHLDLYAKGAGLPEGQMARVLRCGIERYANRFIPALGVLDDGEGPAASFIAPEMLRRDLRLARAAGVEEVWLFGVNGLNDDYLAAIRETLPLERLPQHAASY